MKDLVICRKVNEGADDNGDASELYTAIPINVLPAVRNRVDMTLPMRDLTDDMFLAGYPTAGDSGLQSPSVPWEITDGCLILYREDQAALSADIRAHKFTDTLDYSADKASQRYGRVQESGGAALFVTGTALDCLPAASSASNRMRNVFLPTTAKRRTEAQCIALVTGVLPQLTRTILAQCHSRHNRRLVVKRSNRLDPSKE
ncbi:hypothetical protein BO83DRAFT_402857 [Aspergillus eucalypticola CBS 122712]|uniref:Uncharacterized protein n=1 Tax=Aspergillus eucalypticola (strain CBS 122712 / IBT 29274) TaxID=1448314 RepID=A0A317UP64_ASPEC|nr:uncharacterized protein BO83DRAFT_402857 [Aspergillus eucalypticola CBS 122712]PWY63744.1 hypothetical protein BO83DRAFT_402857 [Aspergillus eucalypticola CBS 122712]